MFLSINGKFCKACRSELYSLQAIDNIKNNKNSKSIKCSFLFHNELIHCDSKLEYACCSWFVENMNPLKIERASDIIPYLLHDKKKNYLPDLKITCKECIYIVECKGYVYPDSLNEKWHRYNETAPIKKQALIGWCKENSYEPFWFDADTYRIYYKKILRTLTNKVNIV